MKVENGMASHGGEGPLAEGIGGAQLLCALRLLPGVLNSGISTLERSRWTLVLVIWDRLMWQKYFWRYCTTNAIHFLDYLNQYHWKFDCLSIKLINESVAPWVGIALFFFLPKCTLHYRLQGTSHCSALWLSTIPCCKHIYLDKSSWITPTCMAIHWAFQT